MSLGFIDVLGLMAWYPDYIIIQKILTNELNDKLVISPYLFLFDLDPFSSSWVELFSLFEKLRNKWWFYLIFIELFFFGVPEISNVLFILSDGKKEFLERG